MRETAARLERRLRRFYGHAFGSATALALAVGTAAAATNNSTNATNGTAGGNVTASELCGNQLVIAMDNLITLLAAIGPVVGALVAMVAMLVLATTQNPQKKKKWISTRNDAIKYGVGILFVGAIINLLVQVTSPDLATCVSVLG